MLISQSTPSGLDRRQGRPKISLAELRCELASPSNVEGSHQQRLLELTRRLNRVRVLGNDYARLELSHYVATAMDRGAAIT